MGYTKDEIIQAIKSALYDNEFRARAKECKNPCGDCKSSQRIVKIISEVELDVKLRKRIAY